MPPAPPIDPADALFLDFDGTLVEIAAAPDQIVLDSEVPALLDAAAARLGGALAVVSGRGLDELARLVAPFAGALAGGHGNERRTREGTVHRPAPDPALPRIRAVLRNFAAGRPGVLFEDKGLSLALHFRAVPAAAEACQAVAQQAASLAAPRLTVMPGKMVVEVLPRAAAKGAAVEAFLATPPFVGRRPVFVGDDVTDEDGFALVNRLGGVSIRVGAAEAASAARFRIADVPAVVAWLAAFAAAAAG